jgi:hypothetical protein
MKVSPCTTEEDRGRRGVAPLIHNLATRWRRMVKITPRPLYPRCPLNMRVGCLPSQEGRFEIEGNLLSLSRIVNPVCLVPAMNYPAHLSSPCWDLSSPYLLSLLGLVQPIPLVPTGTCPAHISSLCWDLSSPYL